MKDIVLNILSKYLEKFPDEQERQKKLVNYLNTHSDLQLTDWSNFDGHITAGGFVYAIKEEKILLLFHKELNMHLYPGGHSEPNDENPLNTAIREVFEETGLDKLELVKICDDKLVPIDIDTHIIGYNKKRNLPEHYHFDFRYLFTIDEITNVKLDEEESSDYKWTDINALYENKNDEKVEYKIKEIIIKYKNNNI